MGLGRLLLLTQGYHSEALVACYDSRFLTQKARLMAAHLPVTIAVQAKNYDRIKEPQLIYSRLQPSAQGLELCMKFVAGHVGSRLEP